jgi:MarR family transcriptional regulator for hemolysin
MEADGLLERRPDPADRRARCLYLTRKAKPLLDKIWRLSELGRAETFAGISRQERDAFMRLLERLHSNVCALDGQPVEAPHVAAGTRVSKSGNAVNRSRRTRAQ